MPNSIRIQFYLDADDFKDIQEHTSGEFGGLGIEVGIEDGFVKVISPIDDTPAARAGIEAGDIIIKLDDTAVKGLDLDEAVELMRGKKGTDITITIVREGADQPFDITVTRDIIKVRSVRSNVREDEFGYLRIAQFQGHTGEDLGKQIKKLRKENPDLKGFILDLRNNPGGVLQASVEVADHFLNEGMIVYTQGRQDDTNNEYHASPGDLIEGLPLVVLVNSGSASASEIVAGALQDQGRAIILGTQSFGKGSVQSIIPITNERAIKITTARYYTPSGRSIQVEGITPDILVEPVRVTALKRGFRVTESDLSGHLENDKDEANKRGDNDKVSSQTKLQNSDSQLYEAINILKGFNLLNKPPKSAIADKEPQNTDVSDASSAI